MFVCFIHVLVYGMFGVLFGACLKGPNKMIQWSMTTHKMVALNTTTPTLLSPPGTHSGVDITVQNINPSGYIYVGAANLTSSNYGFRIDPSYAISLELNGKDALYALGSTEGLSVTVLTTSLEYGA